MGTPTSTVPGPAVETASRDADSAVAQDQTRATPRRDLTGVGAPYLGPAMVALGAAVLLVGLAPAPASWGLDFLHAHAVLAMVGVVLPLAAHLQLRLVGRVLGRRMSPVRVRMATAVGGLGLLVAAGSALRFQGLGLELGYRLGMAIVFMAGVLHMSAMLKVLPRRGESVVRAEEPLTKGDDACFTQMRFAHFFLPLGLGLLAYGGPWWTGPGAEATTMQHAAVLSGLHVLLGGHVLVAMYAVSHLAVPRLSGIPAIAAGAIKGELHSTLLGLVGLLAGFFLTPVAPGVGRGLTVFLGFFVFVGAFTFMGVLGANIMKNKSRTQRVTPEFSYIPWVFAGVLWILCGTLMGMMVAAIRPLPVDGVVAAPATRGFAPNIAALATTHAHMVILGGYLMLALGLMSRLIPMDQGRGPPSFQRLKGSFYGLNLALGLFALGAFDAHWSLAGMTLDATFWNGLASISILLAVAGWFVSLRPVERRSRLA